MRKKAKPRALTPLEILETNVQWLEKEISQVEKVTANFDDLVVRWEACQDKRNRIEKLIREVQIFRIPAFNEMSGRDLLTGR